MTSGQTEDADRRPGGRESADGSRTAQPLFSTTVWLGLILAVVTIAAFVVFQISGAQSLQLSHDGKTFKVSLAREPLTAHQLKKLLTGGGESPESAQAFRAMLAEAGYVPIDAELSADVVEKLKLKGLLPIDKPGIADELAKRFEKAYGGGEGQDLFDRHRKMQKALESLPSLGELRTRARDQDSPFQPIAGLAIGSLPKEVRARPACDAVVKVSNKALVGTVVTLVNPKDIQRTLTARVQGGVTDASDTVLFFLSESQFKDQLQLEATRKIDGLQGEVADLLVTPATADEARDVPSCPKTKPQQR